MNCSLFLVERIGSVNSLKKVQSLSIPRFYVSGRNKRRAFLPSSWGRKISRAQNRLWNKAYCVTFCHKLFSKNKAKLYSRFEKKIHPQLAWDLKGHGRAWSCQLNGFYTFIVKLLQTELNTVKYSDMLGQT